MTDLEPSDPVSAPPLSSAHGMHPHEPMIRRGVFDPPSAPGVLGRLDGFDILRLLGEGGMGQVYLAHESITESQVAVKIMKPETANDPLEVHRLLPSRHEGLGQGIRRTADEGMGGVGESDRRTIDHGKMKETA